MPPTQKAREKLLKVPSGEQGEQNTGLHYSWNLSLPHGYLSHHLLKFPDFSLVTRNNKISIKYSETFRVGVD